jgi:hypothetical protein
VDLSEDELLERRRSTWDLLFKSSGIITSVTIATTLMRSRGAVSRGAVSYYKISPPTSPPTGGVVDRQWWKNTYFELMVEHEAGEEEHSGEIDAEHDGSTHKRKAEQTEVSSKKRIARETNSASDEPSSAADDDDDSVSDSDFVAEDNSGSDSDSDEDTVPEAGSSTGEDDAGSESASDINERTSDSEAITE